VDPSLPDFGLAILSVEQREAFSQVEIYIGHQGFSRYWCILWKGDHVIHMTSMIDPHNIEMRSMLCVLMGCEQLMNKIKFRLDPMVHEC
jgi:hypothetical protein